MRVLASKTKNEQKCAHRLPTNGGEILTGSSLRNTFREMTLSTSTHKEEKESCPVVSNKEPTKGTRAS